MSLNKTGVTSVRDAAATSGETSTPDPQADTAAPNTQAQKEQAGQDDSAGDGTNAPRSEGTDGVAADAGKQLPPDVVMPSLMDDAGLPRPDLGS